MSIGALLAANKSNINSSEREKKCLEWHNKYLRAYNYWLSSDSAPEGDDSLKGELLSFLIG